MEKNEISVELHLNTKKADQQLSLDLNLADGNVAPTKCSCGRPLQLVGSNGRPKCSACIYGPKRCECGPIAGTLTNPSLSAIK